MICGRDARAGRYALGGDWVTCIEVPVGDPNQNSLEQGISLGTRSIIIGVPQIRSRSDRSKGMQIRQKYSEWLAGIKSVHIRSEVREQLRAPFCAIAKLCLKMASESVCNLKKFNIVPKPIKA